MKINEVYNSDCLLEMQNIADKSIDMILCDLPYGTTKCKWDIIIPLDKLWDSYNRIIKDNGSIILTATQPFGSLLINSNLKMFRYEWIWNKVTARGHLVAKKRPMSQHENILVFYKNAPTYNPQMIDRPKDKIENRRTTEYKRTEIMGGNTTKSPKNITYDKWFPKTILTYSNANSSNKSIHPTQKPTELFEYLIKTYTNKGDLVLDNCSGSGTTGVACQNTDRNYILIEKDKNYFDLSLKRLTENSNRLLNL